MQTGQEQRILLMLIMVARFAIRYLCRAESRHLFAIIALSIIENEWVMIAETDDIVSGQVICFAAPKVQTTYLHEYNTA